MHVTGLFVDPERFCLSYSVPQRHAKVSVTIRTSVKDLMSPATNDVKRNKDAVPGLKPSTIEGTHPGKEGSL